MSKEDFWAGIGTGISAIGTALAWLWNAGPLQVLFSFLTGSFATYLVQTRLQDRAEKRRIKRENFLEMRAVIYGPLFKAMNRIHGVLESSSGELEAEEIEKVMAHYLYFMVDGELRKAIETFYNRIKRYSVIEHATKGVAEKITADTIKENLELQKQMEATVRYRLFVGSVLVKLVNLPDAILLGETPKEIIEKESAGLKGASIDITVGGYGHSDIEKVHSVCQMALEKMKKAPMFQEREAERKLLAKQAPKIINYLKAFIG